jgi:hypothetical protein
MPGFIEFVIGFAEFTTILPKSPPLSKIHHGSRKDQVFANSMLVRRIACFRTCRVIVGVDNGVIVLVRKHMFMNEIITG